MVTPIDIHRPILRRVRELVSSADVWSEAIWFVDGQEMSASVWRFAGGWAGFVSADAEVDVMAVGVAVEPKISVRAVTSPDSYDVDLFDSLSICIPGARKRRRPLTVMPNPNKDAPHPDHKRLLNH